MSFQTSYRQICANKRVMRRTFPQAHKKLKPRLLGAFYLCIQYSGWRITNTPRECAGLTGGFAILGLDRIWWWLRGFAGRRGNSTGWEESCSRFRANNPPFAIRLQRMGHPDISDSCKGWATRMLAIAERNGPPGDIRVHDYFAADLGLDAEPWTMRSLSTLNAPGAEFACIPAMAESLSLMTTP
jgi:hypothetical protein